MNIISNNCFGGYIYKNVLKAAYTTPFIWNRIHNEDLIKLLENFNKINFKNVEIKKIGKNLEDGFFITIDNLINVFYQHYKFDKNCNTPTLKDDVTNMLGHWSIDIHYNKIWEYILEKYESRLNRMNFNDTFILALEDNNNLDLDKILPLAEKLKFKVILTTKKEIKPSDKLMVLRSNFENDFPGYFSDHYAEDIRKFLTNQ